MMVAQKESAMQINPGGRLDTKDVMGRDNEIARYWDVLTTSTMSSTSSTYCGARRPSKTYRPLWTLSSTTPTTRRTSTTT